MSDIHNMGTNEDYSSAKEQKAWLFWPKLSSAFMERRVILHHKKCLEGISISGPRITGLYLVRHSGEPHCLCVNFPIHWTGTTFSDIISVWHYSTINKYWQLIQLHSSLKQIYFGKISKHYYLERLMRKEDFVDDRDFESSPSAFLGFMQQ